MNGLVKIAVSSLFAFGLAQATVNFPYPQSTNYGGNGIVLSNQAEAATELKAAFEYYLRDKYKESGKYAAIEKDHGSNTYVSEGTGYGMLMMVYFSDNTTSYQSQFDKMWAFYKDGSNEHGLMNWSFGSLTPSNNKANAATDAEMDVAAALIMASYQFGDEKYLDEARALLKNVKQYEFEDNGLHKPGDAWNDKKNPSYIAPAYYRLFAKVDTENAEFWNTTAMNANYALLEANSAEYSTGLFDNWSDASGKGMDKYYGYDAARTPWRLAQDFYWFGESKAKTMLDKLGAWVSSKPASEMKGTIERSGNQMWNDHNSTFVATLMTSLVTDASRQGKLDEYWKEAVSLGEEAYFEQSMKVLCGLLVSGNMPNLADPPAAPQSSSAGPESSAVSSSSGVAPGPGSSSSEPVLNVSSSSAVGPKTSSSAADAIAASALLPAESFALHGRVLQLNLHAASRVDITSVTGVVVKSFRAGANSTSISLADLPCGTYLVRVQSAGVSRIRAFSIK
ncbi:MAG: glycoside hydrolase [Fibrobacter sp.]|nr:glycoside hydrolase [Fibrobacter sp.]